MKEKGILGLMIGVLSYVAGRVTMVTVVFFIFMVIDFVTGLLGSIKADEKYNKETAWKGAIKKTGYLLFWLMGVLVELIVFQEGAAIGININVPIISLAVTFWLLGTEGTSILNNLQKMGVIDMPDWMGKFFGKIKKIDPKINEEQEDK